MWRLFSKEDNMPNIWQAVDANFPTLSDKDSVEEQYRKLHSYMFVLTEQLKYSLANLDSSNWNGTALEKERSETTEKVEKDVSDVSTEVSNLIDKITEVTTALSRLDNRETTSEEKVLSLENFKGNMTAFINPVPEQSTMTIGKSGQTININGSVYINGRLIT